MALKPEDDGLECPIDGERQKGESSEKQDTSIEAWPMEVESNATAGERDIATTIVADAKEENFM